MDQTISQSWMHGMKCEMKLAKTLFIFSIVGLSACGGGGGSSGGSTPPTPSPQSSSAPSSQSISSVVSTSISSVVSSVKNSQNSSSSLSSALSLSSSSSSVGSIQSSQSSIPSSTAISSKNSSSSVSVERLVPSLSITFDAKSLSTLGANSANEGNYSLISGRNGGSAVKFNGVSSPGVLKIPNRDEMKFTTGATFDVWVRRDGNKGMDGYGRTVDNSFVMSVLAKSHDNNGVALVTQASGNSWFATGDATWSGDCTNLTQPNIPMGAWFRVTVTASSALGTAIYIDKKLVSKCTAARPNFSTMNTRDLYIGKYSDTWYPLDGAIQDLQIYKQALTESDVSELDSQITSSSSSSKNSVSSVVSSSSKNSSSNSIISSSSKSSQSSSANSISSSLVSSSSKSSSSSISVSSSSKSSQSSSAASSSSIATFPEALNIQASYDAAGVLSMNFNLGAHSPQKLICDVFIDLEKQQPRIPLKTIDNCATNLPVIINSPAVTNDIFVRVRNDSGKSISQVVTAALPAVSAPTIRSIDWGQTVVSASPLLVQEKGVLLRVHVVAAQPTPVPDLSATLSIGAKTTTLNLKKPSALPAVKDFQSLTSSYSLILTSEWTKPGLSVVLNFNGKKITLTPSFANQKTLYLTLVPVRIGGKLAVIPDDAAFKKEILKAWPLSDVQIRRHSIFDSAEKPLPAEVDVAKVLDEIASLQRVEGDSSHYYGFMPGGLGVAYKSGFSGMGHRPGIVAVGNDTQGFGLLLHELGHNFSLSHINCGGASEPDLNYPYDPNFTGTLGISDDFLKLFLPNKFGDVMSYCFLDEVPSDYSYVKAQDYLEQNPSKPFLSSSVKSQKTQAMILDKSLLISGSISTNNSVEINRILPILRSATINKLSSDYSMLVVDELGVKQEFSLELNTIADAAPDANRMFYLQIPFTKIAYVEVLHQGKTIYSQYINSGDSLNQQKISATINPPALTENETQVCLSWQNSKFPLATLVLNQTEGQKLIFLDASNGNHCVVKDQISEGGQWQIILRNGLKTQEVTVSR
jgi:hypothetical protein